MTCIVRSCCRRRGYYCPVRGAVEMSPDGVSNLHPPDLTPRALFLAITGSEGLQFCSSCCGSPCDAGTIGANLSQHSEADCKPCPDGHACGVAAAVARECEPGSKAGTGADTCAGCSKGTYQPHAGRSYCLACPSGSFCPSHSINPMCICECQTHTWSRAL